VLHVIGMNSLGRGPSRPLGHLGGNATLQALGLHAYGSSVEGSIHKFVKWRRGIANSVQKRERVD